MDTNEHRERSAARDGDEDRRIDEVVLVSGHPWSQKVQFSLSLVSPIACMEIFFAKTVYILQLGADVHLMGVVGVVLSVWGPMCYPINGYLMDRDLLVRWFPWERWGRRAPWFLINSFVVGVSTAMVYVPPTLDSQFLCWWFLLCGAVSSWGLSVLFTCFDASRAELYPTKEERSEVEAVSKIAAGFGSAFGMAPQLIIVAGATLPARGGASCFFLVISLFSLVAIPALCMARQKYDAGKITSFPREFVSFLGVSVNRHYTVYKFFESILSTVMLTTAMYYLILIDGLRGERLSISLVAIGITLSVATLLVMPLWTHFLRRRRRVNTNIVCGAICGLGAIAPALLELSGVAPTPLGFILFAAVEQMTLNGQTYWRCIALGWLVDEDCLACAGRRREAVFVGCINLVSAVGRAIAVALVINGLAASGLDMPNCMQECNHLHNGSEGTSACVDECEFASAEGQPEAVRSYVRFLYYVVVPVCQLAVAALTVTFPIHGERLDRIYTGQAQNFAAMQIGKPAAEPSDSQPPDLRDPAPVLVSG